MDKQRPQGRRKNVTGGGSGVHKRGEGLGSGPVGSSSGYSGRRPSGGSGGMSRATKGAGLSLPVIVILIIVFFLRGGSGSGVTSDYGSSNASSYGS